MPIAPSFTTLADRFDAALALLLLALRHLAPKHPLMEVAIARALHIRAAFARFARHPARSAAGRAQPADATSPCWRAAKPSEPPRHPPGARPMPRAFGWAVGDGLLDTLFRDLFSRLVAHPEMAALAATSPGRATRMLRPLCWMLGITPPAGLFCTRARRSHRARASAPAPQARAEETDPSTKLATQAATHAGAPDTPMQGVGTHAEGSDASTNPEAGTTEAARVSVEAFAAEPPSPELAMLRAMERELARPRPPAVTVPSKPPDWALAWRPETQLMTERMRYMRVVDIDDWPPEV